MLSGIQAEYRQITTGKQGEQGEFITDQVLDWSRTHSTTKLTSQNLQLSPPTTKGLVVPAVSLHLRERLQAVITNQGLSLERQAEVMAASLGDI